MLGESRLILSAILVVIEELGTRQKQMMPDYQIFWHACPMAGMLW